MISYDLHQLLELIDSGFTVAGNMQPQKISRISTLEECQADSLVWISGIKENKEELINSLSAAVFIVPDNLEIEKISKEKTLICVQNPRQTFLRLVNRLYGKKITPGIHPSAIIHPQAKIGQDVHIGPFTYIGESEIGDHTIIYGSCYIYDGVKIGSGVIIHAGTVIGSDGFGYEKNEAGEMEKFPHIGGVIIENNVEIGSNTSIDRGSVGNTVIKQGARIDNLVHIAHNVVVGENAMLIAHAMIGGSTVIGKNAWVAPGAVIRDRIVIGNDAMAGMGSVITKNIPDGETWLGAPAQEISQYLKKKKTE